MTISVGDCWTSTPWATGRYLAIWEMGTARLTTLPWAVNACLRAARVRRSSAALSLVKRMATTFLSMLSCSHLGSLASAGSAGLAGVVFGAVLVEGVVADVLGALVVSSPEATASASCLASVAAAAPRAPSTALPRLVDALLSSVALAVAGVVGAAAGAVVSSLGFSTNM